MGPVEGGDLTGYASLCGTLGKRRAQVHLADDVILSSSRASNNTAAIPHNVMSEASLREFMGRRIRDMVSRGSVAVWEESQTMMGKLALLLKSKLALAVVGTMLVAGGGTTAALAASGTHLQLPVVSQGQSQAHHDNDTASTDGNQNNTGNQGNQNTQQGTNHDDGQQAEGIISSIDTGHSTFVLMPEHGATVTVNVNGQTVFDEGLSAFGSLKVGQHVEVKGTRQSNGSLLATKVEGQSETADDDQGQNDDQDNNENELKGAVVSVDTGRSSFVLKLTDGTTKTITVSAQTEFDGELHSLSDLKAGDLVQVTGNLQSDGSVAASNVHHEDDTSGSGGSDGTGGGSGDGSGSGDGH